MARVPGAVADLLGQIWPRALGKAVKERQRLALERALSPCNESDGLSNRWYRKITGANRTTATRDLGALVDFGLLEAAGEKRGATYRVPLERFKPGLA